MSSAKGRNHREVKPERRHAVRSPTLYGLMASGPRLDQGMALVKRGITSIGTGGSMSWPMPCICCPQAHHDLSSDDKNGMG